MARTVRLLMFTFATIFYGTTIGDLDIFYPHHQRFPFTLIARALNRLPENHQLTQRSVFRVDEAGGKIQRGHQQ